MKVTKLLLLLRSDVNKGLFFFYYPDTVIFYKRARKVSTECLAIIFRGRRNSLEFASPRGPVPKAPRTPYFCSSSTQPFESVTHPSGTVCTASYVPLLAASIRDAF